MPLKFWDEAFATAVFLINRLPSQVINNETPHERLLGQPPDYSFLRTFGCACWPNLRPYNNRKLAFRSKQCVFLGYSPLHKGFKCLEPSVGRVYISRDVVFDEQVFPFSRLHPNAGARLKSELSILPDVLLNPTTTFGDAIILDRCDDSPNRGTSPSFLDATGTNGESNGGGSGENGAENGALHRRHVLCPPGRDTGGSVAEMDLPRSASPAPAQSTSRSGHA